MNMPIVSSLILGCMGLVIGYLAQRSRMCFIAGFRDFIFIRDRELLQGFFSFLCTVWLLTSILYAFGIINRGIPEYQSVQSLSMVEETALRLSTEAGELNENRIRIIAGTGSKSGIRRGIGNRFMLATAIGGWLLGFLSVFAGGCVLRQHVLCAQGQRNSLFFLMGFYAGSIAFYTLLYRFLQWVY